MPRPKSDVQKIRLNLDLTPEARERLERLKGICDADTMSEVIRRSLAAMEELAKHQKSGGSIILRFSDSDEEQRLIVL